METRLKPQVFMEGRKLLQSDPMMEHVQVITFQMPPVNSDPTHWSDSDTKRGRIERKVTGSGDKGVLHIHLPTNHRGGDAAGVEV
jgi:hypothetical protein